MLSQNSILLTQLYKLVLSFSIECLLLKLSAFEFHCVKRRARLFQCGSRMVEPFERWKVKPSSGSIAAQNDDNGSLIARSGPVCEN